MAAADARSKNYRPAFMSVVGLRGANVGAQMSQKPLVTIAVSEVTCGKCQHMDVAPQAMTKTDGGIQHQCKNAHTHTQAFRQPGPSFPTCVADFVHSKY